MKTEITKPFPIPDDLPYKYIGFQSKADQSKFSMKCEDHQEPYIFRSFTDPKIGATGRWTRKDVLINYTLPYGKIFIFDTKEELETWLNSQL